MRWSRKALELEGAVWECMAPGKGKVLVVYCIIAEKARAGGRMVEERCRSYELGRAEIGGGSRWSPEGEPLRLVGCKCCASELQMLRLGKL